LSNTGPLSRESLKLAFVSGHRQWWRKQRLVAKYLKMRWEGVVYPDVYCLPFMLADKFDFLLEGEKVPRGKYDLILAELQSSENQLGYLQSLVEQGDPPVAAIPGPPEILSRDLNERNLRMAMFILKTARHIWAYSPEIKSFCDGLVGHECATIIPWPFDLAATQRLGRSAAGPAGRLQVVVQVPVRFGEVTQNHPFVLKAILQDLWQKLPPGARERFTFHTFAYSDADRDLFSSSGFAEGLPFVLEPRRSYRSFVRFLGECAGIVNLTAGSIMGRITFLSAAVGLPGIFSDNAQYNLRLYPGSGVALLDTGRLRELLDALLSGLSRGSVDARLRCSGEAVQAMGDFAANSRRLRELVAHPVLALPS
jgi:hypothetical protein